MTCPSCEIILADMAAQRETHHQTAHSMGCRNESLRLANKKQTLEIAQLDFDLNKERFLSPMELTKKWLRVVCLGKKQ